MPRRAAPLVSSVLCAIDFSPASRAAVRAAAAIARDTRAPLIALFVNDPLLVAAATIALDARALAERSTREVHRFVRQAVGGGPLPRLRAVVVAGDPGACIADTARRLRCDLIVIGAEGLSGLERVLFGSTTHAVVRRARVPVLIVDRRARRRVGTRWPGRRLVVPVDLAPRSGHDVRAAAALAHASGASLVLVHVVTPAPAPAWYPVDAAIVDRVRVAHARTRLDALAATCGAEARVLTGPLPATLARAAVEARADLVVMGLRGGDGLLRPRPGRIAYAVACDAHVPVYVVPGRRHAAG